MSPAAGTEAAQVMLRYQELMSRFLDTQRSVMLSYLQGPSAEATWPAQSAPAALPSSPRPPAALSAPPVSPSLPVAAPKPAAALAASNGSTSVAKVAESAASNGSTAIQKVQEPPAKAALPAISKESLTAELLNLVSKRTGYPKEMLGFDLDLEAELGIDSIKRVEILGTLAESLGISATGAADPNGPKIELEVLTGIKTLRGIIDYFSNALAPQAATEPAAARIEHQPSNNGPSTNGHGTVGSNGHATQQPVEVEIQRGLVTLVDAPLPSGTSPLLPSGAVVLTDDGRGVALEMAGRLADFGQVTALVRMTTGETDDNEPGVFSADLTDPKAVERLLAELREQLGPIAGLIHLLPLAEAQADDDAVARAHGEVKSLYLLARGLEADLRAAGQKGGALLLTPTMLGGSLGFGSEPMPETFFAGHGGVIGFTKCVAVEWPEVLVRTVDLPADRPASEMAERLLAELQDRKGPREVGHAGSRRVTWEPVMAPLVTDEATLEIDSDDVILITGGARGITAKIAAEIGRRHGCHLVLAGRSPEPAESESPETSALSTPAEIKAAYMARHRREGRPASPATIEAEYGRLLRDREIRGNLAAIREAGAHVHYHDVDVRDKQALAGLLADIETRFGRLDGVIHGAGVIEDKLLKDKTPESFERVFSTKVDSALALAALLKPEQLKFCVFFSSIASRYGNRGQSDYAAANEVLSKLALYLDRAWPCRVAAIAWGPWSEVGMVADLEKHLVARGLKLIAPAVGSAMLADELTYGRKGESEVLIAGGAEHVVQLHASAKKPAETAEALV
jgi:NAD(P)-dependent dehydrogenase (short-subunit alcohol dehydrogenase family)/acyl carrier protein